MKNSAAVHSSESEFHDQWAQETPLAKIAVREAFEAPTALENRTILGLMGDLRGKHLLDVGAGLGESSVDISPCSEPMSRLSTLSPWDGGLRDGTG